MFAPLLCPKCGLRQRRHARYCTRCRFALATQPGWSDLEIAQARPAGLFPRFAAMVIDVVLILLAGSLLASFMTTPSVNSELYSLSTFWSIFVFTIVGWIYFAVMESSSREATLGKMALGIYVADKSNDRVTFGQATRRYFAKVLSALPFFIGFFMAAFTKGHQAFHDQVAGTVVLVR